MNLGSSGWVERISFQGAGEGITGGVAGAGEVMTGSGEGAGDIFVPTTTTEMSESSTDSPAISLVTEKVQCTQCSAGQCSAVQCITVQCSKVQ